MSLAWWWYPTRRFAVDGRDYAVRTTAQLDGLHSTLESEGVVLARDRTPLGGPDSVRNHRLTHGGLDVEAGYHGLWSTAAVARVGDRTVYESHPGRGPAYPSSMAGAAANLGGSDGMWQRSKWAIGVDVATGLLFYLVAKFTDLTTAALVAAAVGIALVVAQRFVKVDLLGGLALFGIVMLLISAGLAWWLRDSEWVKQRSTITGLIAAALFLGDGLFLRGRKLAAGLSRYLLYPDIDIGRLGIGIGVSGLIMAGLNFAVARLASTDVWLFYSTFVDVALTAVLFLGVVRFARPPALAARA